MEFPLKGQIFNIGAMSTFEQLGLARKISPAMPLVDGLVKEENKAKDLSMLLLMALSQLDDQSYIYVLRVGLSVVTIKQDTGWAKVTDPAGNLMFSNLDIATLLELIAKVIEVNLGDFFRTALGSLGSGAE